MRRVSSMCLLAGLAAAIALAAPARAADYGAAPVYGAAESFAMVAVPPAGAIRYNRPCSVSDGYRTIVVACESAAGTVAAMTYVPPIVTYAEPVADPVVYADYVRYRPHHAYRSARWHHRHRHGGWHARGHHGARHGHIRHHGRH